jgi:uncharacterized membrane protein
MTPENKPYDIDQDGQPRMANVVKRNIDALLKRQAEQEKKMGWQDRLADAVTAFTGSITFVIIHLVLFGLWIIWNLGWLGLKPFDPSFVVLAMIASVEAIFLSTFVLISQNRSSALAEKRAELNLQVSLLGEHEITRLVILVKEIAHKMNIEAASDPEIAELTHDVKPEHVLDTIEHKQENRAETTAAK